MNIRKRLPLSRGGALAALAVAASLVTSGCARSNANETLMLMPENAPGGTGVVRRTDLLIAYARSERQDAPLRALVGRRDEAAQAGDAETVHGLEVYGAEWQEIAHRQLAGDEPIYTVVVGVQEELRAVMRSRGLARVVEAGPGVDGVDITDELVAMLPEARRLQR